MAQTVTTRRIQKELDQIRKHPPLEISVGPTDESNIYHWEGILNGPQGTPYADGIFKFSVDFPTDYPMNAPKVKFITRIFHPNISETGDICVDILDKNWSSVYDISKVMLSVSSLLSDPNPSSALNGESAKLYMKDRLLYNKTVKEYVRKYASPENL